MLHSYTSRYIPDIWSETWEDSHTNQAITNFGSFSASVKHRPQCIALHFYAILFVRYVKNKSCPNFCDYLELAATEQAWAMYFSEGNTLLLGNFKHIPFWKRRERLSGLWQNFKTCLKNSHFTMIRWCGSENFDLMLPTVSKRVTVLLYIIDLALRYLV